MKHVDQAEWELLKQHAAAHLESSYWQRGVYCVNPRPTADHPLPVPEVWVPQLVASPIHLMR